MSKAKTKFRHPLTVLLASVCCAAMAFPLFAADGTSPVTANATPAHPQTALVNLIIRLRESGTLKPDEAAELLKLAEADAADARVQSALVALAEAQAQAAQTRAEANAIQAAKAKIAQTKIELSAEAPVATDTTSAVADTVASVATVPAVAAHSVAQPEPVPPAKQNARQPSPDDDEVRVTYVPEVVKAQLREEIKNEVMEQAKQEHWAAPRSFPDWVSRISFYGDFRFRYEALYNHKQNKDSVGSSNFWNYNAINTSSTPFDKLGSANPPTINIDQDRTRLRLRARLGLVADLGDGFTTGMRMATGENNSPVTQNQSLGAAGSGQGGNFSKYSLWLDRAYLKYQSQANSDRALVLTAGRFDNPFLSTSIIWADDLGFDGGVFVLPAQIHYAGLIVESIKPKLVVGVFPVFNTDLNFASNWPDKFKSTDKWLEAAQFRLDLKFHRDFAAKVGIAYYYFTNMVGVTTTYQPSVISDAGETDARRPSFAQKGNTYMELRNILPLYDTKNVRVNSDWEYYGLASPYRDLAFDLQLDYNQFEPFQISLFGEYIKNCGFDQTKILARTPVNNLGKSSSDFVGSGTAWIAGIKVGSALLQRFGDWSLNLNYREVGSDAVIDGFCDSDFGGGGTNVKGFTVGGSIALTKRVTLGAKFMSAAAIQGALIDVSNQPLQTGAPVKNDILQIDINAKF